MSRELLIYANFEVALRYKKKMDKYFLVYVSIGAAILAICLIPSTPRILLFLSASTFLFLGSISYMSRSSMLKDVQNGLLVFKFTPKGWYRNESPVLYRWEDFERVEFADRAITFFEAKQHKIHSSTISPMLMTDSDFNKVKRWIRQHIPAHLKP